MRDVVAVSCTELEEARCCQDRERDNGNGGPSTSQRLAVCTALFVPCLGCAVEALGDDDGTGHVFFRPSSSSDNGARR